MAITSKNTLQLDEINIKLTPFLERASPLARLGIRVFPCDVRGKAEEKIVMRALFGEVEGGAQ